MYTFTRLANGTYRCSHCGSDLKKASIRGHLQRKDHDANAGYRLVDADGIPPPPVHEDAHELLDVTKGYYQQKCIEVTQLQQEINQLKQQNQQMYYEGTSLVKQLEDALERNRQLEQMMQEKEGRLHLMERVVMTVREELEATQQHSQVTFRRLQQLEKALSETENQLQTSIQKQMATETELQKQRQATFNQSRHAAPPPESLPGILELPRSLWTSPDIVTLHAQQTLHLLGSFPRPVLTSSDRKKLLMYTHPDKASAFLEPDHVQTLNQAFSMMKEWLEKGGIMPVRDWKVVLEKFFREIKELRWQVHALRSHVHP